MQGIAFIKGTLSLNVPTRVARGATAVECRVDRHGLDYRWCLAISGSHPLMAAGESVGGQTTGRVVETLPSWWQDGFQIQAEPAEVWRLFGRAHPVILGSD